MVDAARSGDYGPLIFYVLMVAFCLGMALDVGRLSSRIEERLKTGPEQHLYKNVPSWMFRYATPLGGLAMITLGMLIIV
jgi:hypothetical protein